MSHFIYWTLNYWWQSFERIIVFSSFQIFWISSNSQECCCLRKICSNKAAREINKGHNFFKPNMLEILAKTGTFRFKIVCFSDRNSEGILIHEEFHCQIGYFLYLPQLQWLKSSAFPTRILTEFLILEEFHCRLQNSDWKSLKKADDVFLVLFLILRSEFCYRIYVLIRFCRKSDRKNGIMQF